MAMEGFAKVESSHPVLTAYPTLDAFWLQETTVQQEDLIQSYLCNVLPFVIEYIDYVLKRHECFFV